ncbi:hypothetical protein JMJ55_27065 [Belnapia sp. T6]|uniref:Uncharacterized protein n=1 Tax=Belnapia mucosa TaxID=2804532 RepID=A0ABS1VBD4_9PROT|nr:hypothetical protein [Belnapia mucosa]MBL6458996.1 hypothetical protein [Belnapia mucosa]
MMGDQRPPGTSTAYDRIKAAFGSGATPFAVHHLDRVHAADYLVAALRAQVTWAQAEADIRAYLATQGTIPDLINAEVDRARDLLEPWLT